MPELINIFRELYDYTFDTFFIFLFNIPFESFFINNYWIEVSYYIYNNLFTAIISILWVIFLEFLLVLFWRFLFKKFWFDFSKTKLWNIYFLSFILRFFPILWHIWSIFIWMNNISFKKIIIVFLSWYLFFLLIWFFFEQEMWNLYEKIYSFI
jgi:hypothetical protein